MSDTDDTGALPASGRFERMEKALARIETSLSVKADAAAIVRLEDRLTKAEREWRGLETMMREARAEAKPLAAQAEKWQRSTENRLKKIEGVVGTLMGVVVALRITFGTSILAAVLAGVTLFYYLHLL